MNTLKEVSNEFKIADIKWHIPDTGFYASIEFLNKINIDFLIKECSKKDILINTMHAYYLKDYFNNDILKISVGNCEISDIKSGVRDILKLISSLY
jgi:DNA-binding transcriptional MocR family regulator